MVRTLLAQTKRLKKFFGYFFLFDFALANGCREADKKRGNRPPRRRYAISFLPSFSFSILRQQMAAVRQTRKEVAILPKKKVLKKANYLLIPRIFSRFSLPKKAQRKANKRNAVLQGYAPGSRATARGAPLLKKWTKQSRNVSANTVRDN